MLGDLRIDHLTPHRAQGGKYALFVLPDEAAIADNIGHQDGRKAPFDSPFAHPRTNPDYARQHKLELNLRRGECR